MSQTNLNQTLKSNQKSISSKNNLQWEDIFGDYLKNTTLMPSEIRGKKNVWPFESSFVQQIPYYLFTPNKMTKEYKSNVQSFIEGEIDSVKCVEQISLPNYYAKASKTEPDQVEQNHDMLAGALLLKLAKQKRNKQHQSKLSEVLLKGLKKQEFSKEQSQYQKIKNIVNQNIIENKKEKEKNSKEKLRSLKFFQNFFDIGKEFVNKIKNKNFVNNSNLGDPYELKTSKRLNTAKLILDANDEEQKQRYRQNPIAAKTIIQESKVLNKFSQQIKRKADQYIEDLKFSNQLKEKIQSQQAEKYIKFDQIKMKREARKLMQYDTKSLTERTQYDYSQKDEIQLQKNKALLHQNEKCPINTDRSIIQTKIFQPFIKDTSLNSDKELYKYIHKKEFKSVPINNQDYIKNLKNLKHINLIDDKQNFHSENQKQIELNQSIKKMYRRIGGGAFLKPNVNVFHLDDDKSIDIGHGMSDDESMISVNEQYLNNLYTESNMIQKQIKSNLEKLEKENFHKTIKRFTHLEHISKQTIKYNNLKLKQKS